MPIRLTQKEFLKRIKKIHGDKYNYEKVNYINMHTKITIICKKHGEFLQTPINHLQKQGCPYCANNNFKLNVELFIQNSKNIHGNKYDYSESIYLNNRTKLIIKCKIHGNFYQTPYSHLNGNGCGRCSEKTRYSIDEFKEKANSIHKYKYNYDNVIYKNNKQKIKIECPGHGFFWQKACDHLRGKGCISCAGLKKLTKEEFIKKSEKIHGDNYLYDKVEYFNNSTKVVIGCRKHGDFKQSPDCHINQGQGCPKCKGSNPEKIINNILQENNIKYKPEYIFEDLKYINNLRFDFGILDESNNLKLLIEFNGKQHYYYNRLFHKSEKDFEDYKLRDKLKMEYCMKNNIPLYIIKYDEKIKERLVDLFKIS